MKSESSSVEGRPLAVIIPAKDEEQRIAATVRAALEIPAVDRVIVVDDGSTDRTAEVASTAGASVVRHRRNRGKAAAMHSGALAAAAEVAEPAEVAEGRLLLFLDADLEGSAAAGAALVEPVRAGAAAMTIAVLPTQATAGGGRGLVVRLARDGIRRATGWRATQPLSGQRCLTLAAYEAAQPLATGFGVEVGLTIDLWRRGFRIVEVECDLHHRVTGTNLSAQLHRAREFRDVALALARRGLLPPRFDPLPSATARRAATWAARFLRRHQ